MKKLQTIKVLPETVQDLNIIAAINNQKQYEAVAEMAKEKKEALTKKEKNKSSS